jgi:hypothetical protein
MNKQIKNVSYLKKWYQILIKLILINFYFLVISMNNI